MPASSLARSYAKPAWHTTTVAAVSCILSSSSAKRQPSTLHACISVSICFWGSVFGAYGLGYCRWRCRCRCSDSLTFVLTSRFCALFCFTFLFPILMQLSLGLSLFFCLLFLIFFCFFSFCVMQIKSSIHAIKMTLTACYSCCCRLQFKGSKCTL